MMSWLIALSNGLKCGLKSMFASGDSTKVQGYESAVLMMGMF